MTFLSSCGDFHESPPADPSVTNDPLVRRGYVLAGEVGPHLEVWDFSGQPIYVNGEPGYQHYYSQIVDSVTGAAINLGASISSSSTSSYVGVSIGITEGQGELLMETITDSSWVCYDLSADSLSGSISYYNGLSQATCGGQEYFDFVDSIRAPIALNVQERIDAQQPYRSGGGSLCSMGNYISSFGSQGDPMVSHNRVFRLWSTLGSRHFVGFRVVAGTGYRYGYLDVLSGENQIIVYRIAIER